MIRPVRAIRAVALDLDGTLLDACKRVSARSLDAVSSCVEAGIEVVIATARPPRSVQSLLPRELLGLGPLVYYNGALVVDKEGRTLLEQGLSASSASYVVEQLLLAAPECLLTVESGDRIYTNRIQTVDELRAFGILPDDAFMPEVMPLADMLTKPITKVLASCLLLDEVRRERLEEHAAVVVTDGGKLVQAMAKGVSKAAGVQAALEPLGVGAGHVMCFGDDTNDALLFAWCGHPVAMGNAIPSLKRLAREVTLTNDEDGVALVLERLLEAQRGMGEPAS